jgi:hypothetical protein
MFLHIKRKPKLLSLHQLQNHLETKTYVRKYDFKNKISH